MSYILDALRKSEEERRRGELPDPMDFRHAAAAPRRRNRYLWPALVAGLLALNFAGLMIFWAPWRDTAEPQSQQSGVQQDPSAGVRTEQPAFQPPPVHAVSAQNTTAQTSFSTVGSSSTTTRLPSATTPTPYSGVADAQPAVTTVSTAAAPSTVPASAATAPTTQPRLVTAKQSSASAATQSPAARLPAPAPAPAPATAPPFHSPPQQTTTVARRTATRYIPQLDELPADLRRQIPDLVFSSHMYASMPRHRSIIINGRRLREGQFLAGDLIVHEITDKGVIMQFNDTLFEVDVLSQW